MPRDALAPGHAQKTQSPPPRGGRASSESAAINRHVALIVLSDDPWGDLRDYCGEYLREEMQSEGLVRGVPAFSEFLELAALGNAKPVSYAPIALERGVSAKTMAEYFQILEDTLLGFFLEPYRRTRKRRPILTRKSYLFDCGVANVLLRRQVAPGTPEYGKSFEQFVVLETFAAMFYDRRIEELAFWRSASGYEVDLLIDRHTAIGVKSGRARPAPFTHAYRKDTEEPVGRLHRVPHATPRQRRRSAAVASLSGAPEDAFGLRRAVVIKAHRCGSVAA